MRVLFTSQPSSGHWHPLVPLARALEMSGHEVAFASTQGFRPVIEASGFRCFRAGVDDSDEEVRQRREQMAGLGPQEPAYFTLKYVFAGVRAQRALPDMLGIIRDWRPDVVVRENTELAGCVAAECDGVPHAAVQITAARTRFLEVMAEPLHQLRASVGLPPAETADVLYRYLLLSPRPPSLWSRSSPVPPTTHPFRYTGFSQSGEEKLPGWVAKLGQRPTVYATLGTVFNHMTPIHSAILEALREEPINLIITIGRNQNPLDFGEQPAHVHVERYIPQKLLLPYCDLVISHGGSGTMMDALSLGLPMVIIPIAADQPENAQSCAELGVAHVIEAERRSAVAIGDAAREVLYDPAYRRAAQRLRKEIEELPGLEYPTALLERLAAEGTPLVLQPPASQQCT
ncbi:MAG: glycosyltransferase family 1 protein [Chloroflexi bacterium]|nr:glycosyltransferase family 1 protein [Chloroflexota bacterium]